MQPVRPLVSAALRLGRGLSVLLGASTVERGCAGRVVASAEPVRRPVWVDDFCWVDVAMLPLLVVAVLPLAAWIVLRSAAVRMIGSGEQVPDG